MIGIVVPALDPPASLPGLVNELISLGLGPIVVVDDGSTCRSAFRDVEHNAQVTVLRHRVNRGKGEALKTGFAHLLGHRGLTGIITVDADGQHLAGDVKRIRRAAVAGPDELILGVRNFGANVPFKSMIGNRVIRWLLAMAADLRLQDTQTGLRAVPRDLAERCLDLKASRYAFEFEMLLLARTMTVSIQEEAITTVYFDNNRATHFRAALDSLHIFFVLFRFIFVSIMSFCIDIGLFVILHWATDTILFSTYAARIISGTLNFFCNKQIVFLQARQSHVGTQMVGYITLAIIVATVSGLAVRTGSEWFQINPTVVKVGVDLCLFFLSFSVQRFVIFRTRRN